MELFMTSCFFLCVKNVQQNGISVDTQTLENSYHKFVVLLFAQDAAPCKVELRNTLVYTRVKFRSLTSLVLEKNVAIYLNKAIQLINDQIEWIEKQMLAEQSAFGCPFRKRVLSQINLQWTAQKSDLIELLYALDVAGCFNSGNVSLNQIAMYLEDVFHTDLAHFPRDFSEMRIRNNKTPFIDKLKTLLKQRMDKPQKSYRK